MNNLFALLFGALLVASSFQGHAAALKNETVQSVLGEMAKVNKAMKTLLEDNNGIVADNENLVKKNKLWQEQLDSRLRPLSVPLLAKIKASKAEEKRLNVIIKRYNSSCTGTVPKPQYNKCMREKPVLDRLSTKHRRERNNLLVEKAKFDKEWKSYATLINKNQARINKNFKRHLAIKDTVKRYGNSLERYRTRLIALCAKADRGGNGEALHHCNSVSWDGAKRNLPSLDKILRGTRFFGK